MSFPLQLLSLSSQWPRLRGSRSKTQVHGRSAKHVYRSHQSQSFNEGKLAVSGEKDWWHDPNCAHAEWRFSLSDYAKATYDLFFAAKRVHIK